MSMFDSQRLGDDVVFGIRPNMMINQKKENELPNIQIEDIVNVEQISLYIEELKCPICFEIISNARTCVKCEANFCDSCIKKWALNENKECPCCRNSGQNAFLSQRNFGQQNEPSNWKTLKYEQQFTKCPKIFSKLLSTIIAQCHYKDCKNTFNYDDRGSHLKVCKYHETKCPNFKCDVMVTHFTRESHAKECKFIPKDLCDYCGCFIPQQELSQHNCPQSRNNYNKNQLPQFLSSNAVNSSVNQQLDPIQPLSNASFHLIDLGENIEPSILQDEDEQEEQKENVINSLPSSPRNEFTQNFRRFNNSNDPVPLKILESVQESQLMESSITITYKRNILNEENDFDNAHSQIYLESSDDDTDVDYEENIEQIDLDEGYSIPQFFPNISNLHIQKRFNLNHNRSNNNNNQ